MRKMILFICIAVVALGCARKLTPVRPGDVISLNSEEGLLLFAVDTEIDLKKIKIAGKRRLVLSQMVIRDWNYYLVIVPAGEYRYSQVEFTVDYGGWIGEQPITFQLRKQKELDWHFKVEPSKISYAGEIRVRDVTANYLITTARIDVVNRSSLGYVFMREHHPRLLAKYQMTYAGFGNDRFFEHLSQLKPEEQE